MAVKRGPDGKKIKYNRPQHKRVEYAARKRGLFALGTGAGLNFRYDFWDRTTGKVVLAWYPDSGRWMSGQRSGKAATHWQAMNAALGPAPDADS